MNDAELKGKQCQSSALHAFNIDDLHTAYPLYLEAEAHYRAAFRTPGDRVYFMQTWAVRCLGELTEQHTGLSEIYRSETNRFLAEWTEKIIKARVSPKRLEEALTFRLWTESIFLAKGSNIFNDANLAADAGNLEEAKKLVDQAIGSLSESNDPERDAIVAIARSKWEMFLARQEIMKRRIDRDLGNIASAWLRAGRASHLPSETTSTLSRYLSNHKYFALSEALRWRAVKSLNQQAISNDARQGYLEDAERFLLRAANYARKAHDLPSTHVSRLAYSHQTVRERVALMRFMLTGDEQEFNTAMQAWREALNIANALSVRRATLFPGRFYSLKDLELEEFFLNAARAFRNAQWENCVAFLQHWIDSFPIEYRWSWRYSNVMIRLLGASVIANFFSGKLEGRQRIQELDNFARTEPIGSAGRYFANEIVRLQAMSAGDVKDAILKHLCPCFPWIQASTFTIVRPK